MPRSMVGHPNLILETLPEMCAVNEWEFYSNPKRLWGENEWNKIFCKVHGKKFNASFEVQQMPGCCAVLIASYIDTNPWTDEAFIKVVGTISNAAYEAGFGSMMLSQVVLQGHKVKEHVWAKLPEMGWVMSEPFINAKSGNKVVYLTKNLDQKGKVGGLEIAV